MPALQINNPELVRAAAHEFDTIGRDGFLSKYGFGKARDYFLFLNGKYYDSKAICGAAHGYENPKLGPLRANDFSGGEKTVARKLESLGFTVVRTRTPEDEIFRPLVLVENEVTFGGEYDHWQDETGVRYQYPNQYRNRIRAGHPFVYYRGVRRKGGARGIAEYFGVGRIGEIWRDSSVPESESKSRWKWFCSVEDYVAFKTPVPAKLEGEYLENISTALGWRTAVREISRGVFERILRYATVEPSDFVTEVSEAEASLPFIADVQPTFHEAPEDILIKRAKGTRVGGANYVHHRSRHSKVSGDRAEEIVYRWLREKLPQRQADSVDWLAKRGETPGWDIEFRDASGQIVAVEVKGTSSPGFTYIEITGNEWTAAESLRANYWFYLVANCLSTSPRLVCVQDPFGKHLEKRFDVQPANWRLALGEAI